MQDEEPSIAVRGRAKQATHHGVKSFGERYCAKWQYLETGRIKAKGITCRVRRVHFGVTMAEMSIEHSDTLEEKAIVIKKHRRKLQSYFRYGLDYLRDILLNEIHQTMDKFSKLLNLLRFNMKLGRGTL